MGFDISLTKVNKKYFSYQEKISDLDKSVYESKGDNFENTIYYSNEVNVHYLFKKIQEKNNLKINFDESEEMLIKKEDLIFIINYVEENIHSVDGLKKLNEDDVIINNKPGYMYYNKDWWMSEFIIPLKNIIKNYYEEKETIFYGVWF